MLAPHPLPVPLLLPWRLGVLAVSPFEVSPGADEERQPAIVANVTDAVELLTLDHLEHEACIFRPLAEPNERLLRRDDCPAAVDLRDGQLFRRKRLAMSAGELAARRHPV